jgi:SAM-dependent methyltransferase
MYRDTRPAADCAATASTPESWAAAFAHSTRMNRWKALRLASTKEWRLIAQYIPRGSRILDAGCGFGEWVTFLNARGYRAEGIDFSSELVGRLCRAYPAGEWAQGDIRRMPYPAGKFDAVISWGVIEHDEEGPAAALRELHRVLRPGGVVVVTVPVDSPAQRRSADVLHRPPGSPQAFFQYCMSEDELRQHVADAGLAVLESGTLPGAVLNLVFPRIARRTSGRVYRLANFAVFLLFSWMKRYRVMRYCVASKVDR